MRGRWATIPREPSKDAERALPRAILAMPSTPLPGARDTPRSDDGLKGLDLADVHDALISTAYFAPTIIYWKIMMSKVMLSLKR